MIDIADHPCLRLHDKAVITIQINGLRLLEKLTISHYSVFCLFNHSDILQ